MGDCKLVRQCAVDQQGATVQVCSLTTVIKWWSSADGACVKNIIGQLPGGMNDEDWIVQLNWPHSMCSHVGG